MASSGARYRQGYSIGAGALVLAGEKVLLVRLAYGVHKGQWAIPGGYVEAGETVDVAVRREVLEETGVDAQVEGLVGVRSRVMPGDNSAYLIFLLRAAGEDARADGVEVLDARFFTLRDALALPDLTPLTRALVGRASEGALRVLELSPLAGYAASEYALFL